jgi:hypothetical protein
MQMWHENFIECEYQISTLRQMLPPGARSQEWIDLTFSSGSATGLAICKGAWLGRPDEAWKHKCARWLACPTCESKRAGKRAHEMKERLKVARHYLGNDMTVGVLTVTLPGQKHESGIRYKSLKEQYDYAVSRTTLPGLPGWHSMRGMNRLLCGKPDHKGFGKNSQ